MPILVKEIMMKKTVIKIDEALCIGCGECASTCHQGAIKMVDGKAKLVEENHCDGLGMCLGECPVGAITLVEKEAEVISSQEQANDVPIKPALPLQGGCPGSMMKMFEPAHEESERGEDIAPSALTQWPVQLHLLSGQAPFFNDKELLLAADCCAFAMGGFHGDMLRGRSLAIACPKLDDTSPYLEKLTAILKHNRIKSLVVAIMEVPCCRGLEALARKALSECGKDIELRIVTVGLNGDVKS